MSIGRKSYASPKVVTREACMFDGCDRLAHVNGDGRSMKLCAGHRKQESLGKQLAPLREWRAGQQYNWPRMKEITLRWANAEGDTEEERAWEYVVRGWKKYFEGRLRGKR